MLVKLNGKPLLWYSIHSLKHFTDSQKICVATSEDYSDNPIFEFASKMGIQCFRGDLQNPAKRFRDLLEVTDCKYAVRVCGDNVFVNHNMLNNLRSILNRNEYDFISNTKERTFPFGMSVEAVKREVYLKYYKHFNIEYGDFEHVMSYFYREEEIERFFWKNDLYPKASGMHLAIDTSKDLKVVENILRKLDEPYYECSLEKLSELYNGQ